MRLVGLARAFDRAVDALASALHVRQFEAEIDLEMPAIAEVRLGLASRELRLLSYVAGNPMLWDYPVGEYFLRPMVDTRILLAWLIGKDEPDLYERFKAFGAGRLKLHKLHLEDFVEAEELQGEFEDYLDYLEGRVNRETLEEFQTVDLGSNFAGVTIREMAKQSGLKRLYDLDYVPLSAELHGEWRSLEEWDLAASADPLHQGHQFGTFSFERTGASIQIVGHAFYVMADAVGEVFNSLGVDISHELDVCQKEFASAIKRARDQAAAADQASP